MVDPAVLIGGGVTAAYFLKDQFNKIFGPTSEYLGDKLQDIVKNRIENMNKILTNTTEILGDELDRPGAIHPRIIERLLNSGSFIEDDLIQKYFAGVVATSRTFDGKDDRGLYFLDLITRMSNIDIKIHYILYSRLRKKYLGTSLSIFKEEDCLSLYNYIEVEEFFSEFQQYYQEPIDKASILTESVSRLLKEELSNKIIIGPKGFIEERVKSFYGCTDFTLGRRYIRPVLVDSYSGVKTVVRLDLFGDRGTGGVKPLIGGMEPNEIFLFYTPSPLGAKLFLWAHGEGQRLASDIFDSSWREKIQIGPQF